MREASSIRAVERSSAILFSATMPAATADGDGAPAALLEAQTALLERLGNGMTIEACLAACLDTFARFSTEAAALVIWRQRGCAATCHASSRRLGPLADALVAAVEAVDRPLVETATLTDLARRHGLVVQASKPITTADAEIEARFLVLGEAPAILDSTERAMQSLVAVLRFALQSAAKSTALATANERFAAIARSIPGVVYQRIVKPDGDIRYTYISEAAEELFGVSPQEIIANPQALFDCHGPEYYATFKDRLVKASEALELWDVEARIITRDGTRKYTHAIAKPHREPDGAVVWDGVILDATRIKEAELAAAASEARTRDAIIESIPQAFALYDANDLLVTWNTRFLALYPQLADQIVAGRAYVEIVRAELQRGIDPLPEGVEPEFRLYERLAQHHLANYTAERRLPDGRWILVNEHRTADGGTVILHTDISELKGREAALARSNRELETFASIASHDLQEPLRKIDAFGDRLKRRYHETLGDDGRMYVERMQSAVGRMRSLIEDLLDYSRITTKAKPFDRVRLDEVLDEVKSDLQVAIETSDATIAAVALPVIDADRTQMRQLLQNLIANALKFRKPDLPPVISIDCVQGPASRPGAPGADAGERVCISITDNGIGFEMKYAERIFGIFQRLHNRAEYEGTGVGLATCRKIVERHNGTLTVTSEPGVGTTFTIDIPVEQPSTDCEANR
jgi:PAS domain S-box-containing protein